MFSLAFPKKKRRNIDDDVCDEREKEGGRRKAREGKGDRGGGTPSALIH